MPYYGVANGRNTGVYDNWDDCKKQVHRYSHCDFKKFDTPDQAWDFVDHSSSSNGDKYVNDAYNSNSKAIACRSDNQIVSKNNCQEARTYKRTDYMEGRNGIVVRERTCTSGRHGNGYYVEKRIRTYWES